MRRIRVGERVDADDLGARVGGRPLVLAGFEWPRCKACGGPMQFEFYIPLDEFHGLAGRALLAFQCQNQPGLCDEWDPNSGGNCAVVVDAAGSVAVEPPRLTSAQDKQFKGDRTLIEPPRALVSASIEESAVGTVGGEPVWVQADETPTCTCGAQMTLAMQLDEAAHDGLNFGGGGTAYTFVCSPCSIARFLWQC
jgi:hypothetical protein